MCVTCVQLSERTEKDAESPGAGGVNCEPFSVSAEN